MNPKQSRFRLSTLVVLLLLTSHIPSAIGVCDSRYKPESGTLGYSLREDGRCEGFYRQQVNTRAPDLVLAALWDRKLTGQWPSHVTLRWHEDRSDSVQIEGTALGEREYYRVDTIVTGSTQYSWPTAVIAKSGLSSSDVGFVAYHDGARRTYLPLISGGVNQAGDTYRAILFSSADLARISVDLRAIDTGSLVTSKIFSPQALGVFLANRAIDLELPPVGRGRYRVAFAAVARGSRDIGALAFDLNVP